MWLGTVAHHFSELLFSISLSPPKYPGKYTKIRILRTLRSCVCTVKVSDFVHFCLPATLWQMRLTVHWGTRTRTSASSSQGRVGLGKPVSSQMLTVYQLNICTFQGEFWSHCHHPVSHSYTYSYHECPRHKRTTRRMQFMPLGSVNENKNKTCCLTLWCSLGSWE